MKPFDSQRPSLRSDPARSALPQRLALIVLRTLIGWHFLYEGYFKLLRPAWGRDGAPLEPWSAAGYLRSASGPFADLFQALGNTPWIGTLDIAIAVALVVIGLSLMLGLFVRAACIGAFTMLMLFYVSALPLSGLPEPRTEGAYLFVNKNLIEAAAVMVIFFFSKSYLPYLPYLPVNPSVPASEKIHAHP
jgi:thiosulfate dehydrogenase [quinone] large subunit